METARHWRHVQYWSKEREDGDGRIHRITIAPLHNGYQVKLFLLDFPSPQVETLITSYVLTLSEAFQRGESALESSLYKQRTSSAHR